MITCQIKHPCLIKLGKIFSEMGWKSPAIWRKQLSLSLLWAAIKKLRGEVWRKSNYETDLQSIQKKSLHFGFGGFLLRWEFSVHKVYWFCWENRRLLVTYFLSRSFLNRIKMFFCNLEVLCHVCQKYYRVTFIHHQII